jgi:selenophosphate synthase
VDWDDAVPEPVRALLCDAMTSGGLLVAAGPDRADAMERALAADRIGTLAAGESGRIAVNA